MKKVVRECVKEETGKNREHMKERYGKETQYKKKAKKKRWTERQRDKI